MWYIFNANESCIASCSQEPNHEDLLTRGECSVESNESYAIDDIILQGDMIVQKPPYMPSLEEAQKAKWDEIKAIRDQNEQSGVYYMGKVLDSDTLSVQRISIAVQAAQVAIALGQDFTIDWTYQDNTVLTMTAEQITGIPVALAQYSNELHQTARSLREQIEAATTEEELADIVWPE